MIPTDELALLESRVQRALCSGDDSALRVLGYGEISLVIGWPREGPRWACKRLPPFASSADADAYTETLDAYLEVLDRRGVRVAPTTVRRTAVPDGRLAVYCVQEVLPSDSLAVEVVARGGRTARDLLGGIVDTALEVVDDHVGLDAQLSNWALMEGQLTYFDVTTPLLRGPDGSERLDTEIFLASLPPVLRGPVRRFVLPGIMQRYHRPRSVVLDLAANLIKEDLEGWIGPVLAAVEGRVDPPLSDAEVYSDYRSDARTWGLLQAVRRADRLWQRKVRRRTYPFLLPARIQR